MRHSGKLYGAETPVGRLPGALDCEKVVRLIFKNHYIIKKRNVHYKLWRTWISVMWTVKISFAFHVQLRELLFV